MSKRPSYREAVEWIAYNDEPTIEDSQAVAEQISVCLLAHITDKKPIDVAHDVLMRRRLEVAKP